MNQYSIEYGLKYKDKRRKVFFAFYLGMALNFASIYIGNPYIVSIIVLAIAAIMTFKWLSDAVPWAVLVSVVAANPVNLNSSIALNLLFGIFLLIFKPAFGKKLPGWLYIIYPFAIISLVGSAFSWDTGGAFTQLAAIGNYVVGPFFLIPIIYFRLQRENDCNVILLSFVLSFIVPSAFLMLLARLFGTPLIDINLIDLEYLVNVSVYNFGNVSFYLTRTQVGIPLAVLISVSFGLIISSVSKYIRLVSLLSMFTCIFLLLVTGSVGSSLAALFGMTLIIVIAHRYTSVKKYMIILPALVFLALLGWRQIPQGIKDYVGVRYEQKLSGGINTSDRSWRWESSLIYLIENPLGRGWDLYVAPIRTYPHNDYLSYGIAFGFIFSLLYFLIPIGILVRILSTKIHYWKPELFALFLAGIGSVTVLLINSFTDHLTANRWYFNVVWSVVWYCYFVSRTSIVLGNYRMVPGSP